MLRPLLFIFLILFPFSILLSQEVCDNGMDDDGDGLVDLKDDECTCLHIRERPDLYSMIQNHSFEDTVCCPETWSYPFTDRLKCAKGWHVPTKATTDFMHKCDFVFNSLKAIPALQQFPDGNGIGGAGYHYLEPNDIYTEYFAVCLGWPMKKNQKYFLKFFIASFPNSTGGYLCRNGDIFYPEISLAIWGSRTATMICNKNKLNTYNCPTTVDSSWHIIGSVKYQPKSEWERVVIEIDAPFDVKGLLIGAPCDLPAGYARQDTCTPYFVFDDFLLNEADRFQSVELNKRYFNCSDSAVIRASVDTTGGTWQWYKNDTALVGETGSELHLTAAGFGGGQYTARYSLGSECETVSTDIAFNWAEPPEADFAFDTVCYGEAVTFSDRSKRGGSPIVDYQWMLDDDSVITSVKKVSYGFDSSGMHAVGLIISDTAGCGDTVFKQIYQPDSFQVLLDAVHEITVGENIKLQPFTIGGMGSLSYRWQPAESLSCGDCPSPMANPVSDTKYYLEIEDELGCTALDSTIIFVTKSSRIVIPNAFSPNGDGINDYFRIQYFYPENYHLQIFNRWGQIVFESTDPLEAWDGRYQGKLLNGGTYVYQLRYTNEIGELRKKAGNVTILR